MQNKEVKRENVTRELNSTKCSRTKAQNGYKSALKR